MTGRVARGPKRRPKRESAEVQLQFAPETGPPVAVTGIDRVRHPRTSGPTSAPDTIRNQCTAHKRDGARCRKSSIIGANVCGKHGGSAPQVKRAARVRLAMAADDLMKQLLKIATFSEDESVRLRAVTAALDRAGFGPGAQVEVTHEVKPWEALISRIDRSGPPAPYRPDPAALLQRATDDDDDDVVDVEVVEDRTPAPAPTAVPRTANGKRIPAARVEQLQSWNDLYGDDAPPSHVPGSARISRGL